MFPRIAIRHVADALLDVADAALGPDNVALPRDRDARIARADAAEPSATGPDAHREHPHRTRLRIERVRRRGAVAPRAQHCITPIARAAASKARPAASRER